MKMNSQVSLEMFYVLINVCICVCVCVCVSGGGGGGGRRLCVYVCVCVVYLGEMSNVVLPQVIFVITCLQRIIHG